MLYSLSVEGTPQKQMREWLSGGASPCQGEGRGFESRLALFLCPDSGNTVRAFLVKDLVQGIPVNAEISVYCLRYYVEN